jgi:hypothetical protein
MLIKFCIFSLKFAYLDIELQRVVQTFGEDFIDVRNVKVKKVPGTKTRGLYGWTTFHGTIDNSFKAFCNIYVKQGGEYRLMPFKLLPQPICDFVNSEKTYVPEFVKVSNFTQPWSCPVSNVKYSLSFDVFHKRCFIR